MGAAVGPRMLARPAPSSKYAARLDEASHERRPEPAGGAALGAYDQPSLAFQAIRTTDMVYLGFEFYNAKARRGLRARPRSSPRTPSSPIYMVVVFPSQHLGEECVAYSTSLTTWPTPPLQRRPCRFQLARLRARRHDERSPTRWPACWTGPRRTPELVPAAGAAGSPAAPDPLHTALEIPWQLWLTPLEHGTWHHATSPVTFKQITELWHTRLGAGGLEPPVGHPAAQGLLGARLPRHLCRTAGRPVAHVARPRTTGSTSWP